MRPRCAAALPLVASMLASSCAAPAIGNDVASSEPETSAGADAGATPADAGSSTPAPAPTTPLQTLTVTLLGPGTVLSTPSGLVCKDKTCTGRFPSGTTVGLVPAPTGTAKFSAWGKGCSGADTCAPTMNGDVEVSAAFDPFEGMYVGSFELKVAANGCTFDNKGPFTVTIGSDTNGLSSSATSSGWELRVPSFGCKVVGTLGATASKGLVTLSGSLVTGTWTFTLDNGAGSVAIPYKATWSGTTLVGGWECEGCSGSFTVLRLPVLAP